LGKIIDLRIKDISKFYKNIKIDEFVVMPNHVHILIWVKFSVGNAYTGSNGKEANGNWERNAYMRSLLPVKRADMLIPKIIENWG